MAELVFMAESRKRLQWEPLSLFMTLFANVHRNPKKKSFKLSDFFPFHIKQRAKHKDLPKGKISDLKLLFPKKKDW